MLLAQELLLHEVITALFCTDAWACEHRVPENLQSRQTILLGHTHAYAAWRSSSIASTAGQLCTWLHDRNLSSCSCLLSESLCKAMTPYMDSPERALVRSLHITLLSSAFIEAWQCCEPILTVQIQSPCQWSS